MLAQYASPGEGMCSVAQLPSLSLTGHVCVCVCVCCATLQLLLDPLFSQPSSSDRLIKRTESEVECVRLQEKREIERPCAN